MHPTRHLTHLTLGAFALAGLAAASPACSVPCEDTLTCPKPLEEGGGGSGAGHTGAAGPGGAAQGGGGNTFTDLGEPCGAPGECQSGHCVDGVCCEAACDGDCVTCAASGSEGTCTSHPAGEDPESDCGSGVCDGAGTCATGAHVWSKRFGQSGTGILTHLVAEAHEGGVVVTGRHEGPVDFGDGSLTGSGPFWASFSASGDLNWSAGQGMATGATMETTAMALLSGGALIAAGTFSGTLLNFPSADVVSDGADVFLKLFGASGAGEVVGFSGPGNQSAAGLAPLGADTMVLAVNQSSGSISLGGSSFAASGASTVIGGLDATGDHLWSKPLAPLNTTASAVVPSSAQQVIVVGHHAGTTTIGTTQLTGSGLFAAGVQSDGTILWARSVENAELEVSGPASGGGVWLAGRFSQPVDFGRGYAFTPSGTDLFVARLSAAGTTEFVLAIEESFDLAAVHGDSQGGVFLVGMPVGEAPDLGGGPLPGGDADVLIARFAADGTHLWSRRFVHDWNQEPRSGVVTSSGKMALVADIMGSIDLGGGALTAEEYDGLVGMFDP